MRRRLNVNDFIFPVFVYESESSYKKNSKSSSYFGNSKVPFKNINSYFQELINLKIRNVLLFGVPKGRNYLGTESFNKNGVTQNTIRRIKQSFGSRINIISDVCICQYKTVGHCGIGNNHANGKITNGKQHEKFKIDNDKTLEALGRIAISLCEAGTDFVAPSSMMDGQVLYLKTLLKDLGHDKVKIMSYSAKHNSCLYSPFRKNNFHNPEAIDKSSYQSSYYNYRESLREVLSDVNEGADWIMVKPSFWYMDIMQTIGKISKKTLVVQNVSGEYAMIKAATENKWIDEKEWNLFLISSLKRAGAGKIISYYIYELVKRKTQ
ncbi:MAG: porphobilinogen synthase [Thermoproteota archaeon]|nr:porphobilinogen synthase [Thermoproteota archaeon]